MADVIVTVVDGRAVVQIASNEVSTAILAEAAGSAAAAQAARDQAIGLDAEEVSATTYALSAADQGKVLFYTGATTGTFTLGSGLWPLTVEVRWHGLGQPRIEEDGPAIIGDNRAVANQGNFIVLRPGLESETYYVDGAAIP